MDDPVLNIPARSDRLRRQIAFVLEADKLKSVLRQSYVTNSERRENSSEHSWHVALLTMILAEYANRSIDVCKVIRMMLVHDLVEIDAGDTFIYDDSGNASKATRERAAAERIFGLLPDDQGVETRDLWEEFEMQRSAEAKFANALDRLMPVLHNYFTHGRSWREHGITQKQALAKNRKIADGAEELWALARSLIVAALR
jgi:5'-deoxynucleotidase YfbR-like HD superfamily hydrolase